MDDATVEITRIINISNDNEAERRRKSNVGDVRSLRNSRGDAITRSRIITSTNEVNGGSRSRSITSGDNKTGNGLRRTKMRAGGTTSSGDGLPEMKH